VTRSMDKAVVLASVDFGSRVAEEETERLIEYFVETDQWRRILNGDIDIVYGPKGSGKSAIYTVLLRKEDELFDRQIVLSSAENPSGAPAFRDLAADPPASEREFVALWKLYVVSLVASLLDDYTVSNKHARELTKVLADSRLIPPPKNLSARIRSILEYVRRGRLETAVTVDPATGVPVFTGRIVFSEPSADEAKRGLLSLTSVLALANDALEAEGLTAWLLFDRLDVAFPGSVELERNALRALFRTYLDLAGYRSIAPKVFLRTDIWASITSGGFREASHITRTATIEWERSALLSLILRRLLQSEAVCQYYSVDRDEVLGDAGRQEALIRRVFPLQVDTGRNPETFDWMIGRTRDATGKVAPRELIHLLTEARNLQIAQMESGLAAPEGEQLFDRQALRAALPEVSRVRLEQTVFAEYPDLKPFLERLRDEKATQLPETLGQIWRLPVDKANEVARRLVEVGVLEELGARDAPKYRVPFLYRPALGVIQGTADI
jgi:hypothetical protein